MQRNCKFAGGLAGTPHGDADRGLAGFSRIFDLSYTLLRSLGLKSVKKDAHVATFAFSEDAPPEHQVRLSWADRDDPSSPSIKIRIVENRPEMRWYGWTDRELKNCSGKGACKGEGEYVIATDSLHNYPPIDWQTSMYSAFHELELRTKRGLDPRARWGMSLRFLPSP